MSMEGRRQFIPREPGDSELTQAELDAQERDNGKFSGLARKAAIAAVIGAAAFGSEAAMAQQGRESVASPDVQRVQNEINEERALDTLVHDVATRDWPALSELMDGATVREATQGKSSIFYVYLPSKNTVVEVPFEKKSSDTKEWGPAFAAQLLGRMSNQGLVKYKKMSDGKLEFVDVSHFEQELRWFTPNQLAKVSAGYHKKYHMSREAEMLLWDIDFYMENNKTEEIKQFLPKLIAELHVTNRLSSTLMKADAQEGRSEDPYPTVVADDQKEAEYESKDFPKGEINGVWEMSKEKLGEDIVHKAGEEVQEDDNKHLQEWLPKLIDELQSRLDRAEIQVEAK